MRKRTKIFNWIFMAVLAGVGQAVSHGVYPAADKSPSGRPIDFAHQVAPILKQRCVKCHGGEKAEGGFSLNTRALLLDAEAAVPGEAGKSRMFELVTSRDPKDQMPPKELPRLPAGEVAVLRAWIDQGLPWDEGFTFEPARYEPPLRPRTVELPAVQDGRTNPIDRLLDAYSAQRKLPRPAPLSDAAFARRASLDLVGLLPSPEQLQKLLDDPSPQRREQLVERLLADDQAYAEHWLTFWNDLLRNDYSGTGYIDGGRKQITQWLYRSLVENKPYNQFVRELIAPGGDAEGFIAGIKWRGNVNSSQTREIQFAQNVSQVFLGINMKCASCHDSFIDRWKLDEAYGLAAIYSTRPLEIHRCDKPTGETAAAAWIFPELGDIDPAAAQPERLKQLAGLMTHPENGRLTRTIVNRLWDRLMGRGVVHPVDAMHTEPYDADLLEFLAAYLVEQNYDLKAVLELIVGSQAYQSQAAALEDRPAAGQYVYRGPVVKRMTAEQFIDALWQITAAAPDKPQAGVQRADAGRMVRASLVRSDLLMRSLGRPNREQVVTTRPETLTTLQAIDLANGQPLADLIRRGGGRLLATKQPTEEVINSLYLHALARRPTETEAAVAAEILGSPPAPAGAEDLLWAVFMLPEFQLIQ